MPATRGIKRKAAATVTATSTAARAPAKSRKKVQGEQPTKKAESRPVIPKPLAYTPSLLPPTLQFSLPDAISHLSSHDPRFKLMFDSIPCRPFHEPIEAVDPYRTLVTSIIGQQVSWMAAKAITKRFRAHFGFEEDDQSFPTPMQVANAEVIKLREVGLSFRKAEYSECLCNASADSSHMPGGTLCRRQAVYSALA